MLLLWRHQHLCEEVGGGGSSGRLMRRLLLWLVEWFVQLLWLLLYVGFGSLCYGMCSDGGCNRIKRAGGLRLLHHFRVIDHIHLTFKRLLGGGLARAFFFLGFIVGVATGAGVAGDDAVEAAQGFRAGNAIGADAVGALKLRNGVDGVAVIEAVDGIRVEAVDGRKAALQLTDEIARIAEFEGDVGG